MPGWDQPGFDDSQLEAATVAEDLHSESAGPSRRCRCGAWRNCPPRITEPKPGVYVVDLGQNLVGWARLQAARRQGPEGHRAPCGDAQSRRHHLHGQPARGQSHGHLFPGRRAEARVSSPISPFTASGMWRSRAWMPSLRPKTSPAWWSIPLFRARAIHLFGTAGQQAGGKHRLGAEGQFPGCAHRLSATR